MTRLSKLILLITTFSFTQLLSAQEKKSDQQLKIYLEQLKATNVDTVLIIKSGCTGCEVKYYDSSKAIADGQDIYVLTQHSGKFKLAIFDDVKVSKFIDADTCSVFEFVNQNKSILRQKATFYETEIPKIKSKADFYPPSSIHYSYEELNIHLSDFHYDFEVVDGDKDHFGLQRDKEKWLIQTKEIIKMVFNYSQSLKGWRRKAVYNRYRFDLCFGARHFKCYSKAAIDNTHAAYHYSYSRSFSLNYKCINDFAGR